MVDFLRCLGRSRLYRNMLSIHLCNAITDWVHLRGKAVVIPCSLIAVRIPTCQQYGNKRIANLQTCLKLCCLMVVMPCVRCAMRFMLSVTIIDSTWWLLVAWRLFGTRLSANIMIKKCSVRLSRVYQRNTTWYYASSAYHHVLWMYVNRFLQSDYQNEYFPNALCKYTNNVIPLLTQWSYVFFCPNPSIYGLHVSYRWHTYFYYLCIVMALGPFHYIGFILILA